ncbi:c6 finger domain-containing protein [Nannochloropsis gaditana]|uniref:C6 finger domain-containing protein n=1 Tax=Nannochloropsis gaditana TaxID=72520 RepID=W7TX08_9STRA|nr:c6 finger domain-containing protein [Nannochloropsis gaditana]
MREEENKGQHHVHEEEEQKKAMKCGTMISSKNPSAACRTFWMAGQPLDPMVAQRKGDAPGGGEVQRAPRRRLRDGRTCLECKRSKVKCDRKQPSCTRCARSNLKCLPQKRKPGRPRWGPYISIMGDSRGGPSSTSLPPPRTWLGPSGPTLVPALPSSERPRGVTGGREGGLDRLPVSKAVTQTAPGMHMLYQLQQQQERQQQEQQLQQHHHHYHHHHHQQGQHQEQQPRRGGPTPQTQSAWHRKPSHPSLVAASVTPRTQDPETGGGQRMGRGEEGVRKEGGGDQDGTFLSRIAAFLQQNTLQGTKPRATLHTWHHWGQYHGQDGTKGLLPLLSVLMQVSLPPSRPPSTAARTFQASGGGGGLRGCEEVTKGGDSEGMVTQKTIDWEKGGEEGGFEGRKMREMMRARWLAIKSQTIKQEKGEGGGGGKGGGNRTDASPSDEERMLTFLRVGKGISHCGPACCTIGFHRDAGVSVDVNERFENRFMSRNSLQASTLIPPLLWQQCIASESRDAYVDIFLNLVFGPSPVPTEVRSELLVQDRGGVIVPARVCLRYFVSDNGNMHAIMLAIEPYR